VQVSDTVEVVLKPVYNPQGHVAGHLSVGIPKQVWTYHCGSSRLMYLLTFSEGALVKIDTGGYGHQGLKPQRAYIDLAWSLGADRGYNKRQAAYHRGTAA
jgi:Protein of unknown function (DUF2845)